MVYARKNENVATEEYYEFNILKSYIMANVRIYVVHDIVFMKYRSEDQFRHNYPKIFKIGLNRELT